MYEVNIKILFNLINGVYPNIFLTLYDYLGRFRVWQFHSRSERKRNYRKRSGTGILSDLERFRNVSFNG